MPAGQAGSDPPVVDGGGRSVDRMTERLDREKRNVPERLDDEDSYVVPTEQLTCPRK